MIPGLLDGAIVVFLGLVFGSFATALSWRVPRALPWAFGTRGSRGLARSACPHCGRILSVRDLIPVLSWMLLGGKCRTCRAPLSMRYPLTELGVLAACLGVFAVWGLNPQSLLLMVAVPFLAALILIDMDHMILPDSLVLIVAFLGLAFLLLRVAGAGYGEDALRQTLFLHGGGAALFGGVAVLARWGGRIALRKEALGLGDVKFFAAAGLWLGAAYLPFFLVFSGAAGLIWGVGAGGLSGKRVFPFGPALILALYAGFLLTGTGITPLIARS